MVKKHMHVSYAKRTIEVDEQNKELNFSYN